MKTKHLREEGGGGWVEGGRSPTRSAAERSVDYGNIIANFTKSGGKLTYDNPPLYWENTYLEETKGQLKRCLMMWGIL